MHRLKILCFLLIPFFLFGSWQTQTEDEALFLRRIADFWEEGEYLVAKSQIEEFLTVYPASGFGDTLRSALGDLLLREKNYREALNCYSKITTPEIVQSSFLNQMQCLYQLGWYATLADGCEEFLKKESLEEEQKLQSTYFLAIALYQQCLNTKEPDLLVRLAQRAKPWFQTLFESKLSTEVAQAFAHLCCILKEHPQAAAIILQQARKEGEVDEELLFQAALIQAEYDKELAIQTFSEITEMGKTKAQDAAYNALVLSFDAGHFDLLVTKKEELLKKIPKERVGLVHLFLGRSFLALQQYPEAVVELQLWADTADGLSPEFEKGGYLKWLEASFLAEDLASFDSVLNKLETASLSSAELQTVRLSRAKLLRKKGEFDQAREELGSLSPSEELCFEQVQLEYLAKNWKECQAQATVFLASYGESPTLAPHVFRYLVSSLMEQDAKQALVEQLTLLKENLLFNETERAHWQFLLAKSYFELANYERAKEFLEETKPFPERANAELLLAFCQRELGNKELFYSLAENALSQGADLIDAGSLHAALFNAALEQGQLERAEEHLYAAFEKGTLVTEQNLLWLVERYGEKHLERSAKMLDFCLEKKKEEALLVKRGKIHQRLGENQKAVELLEQANSEEGKLLLAENLLAIQEKERGLALLDEILGQMTTLRSETAASACLQRARQRVLSGEEKEIQKALIEFKNLILQRSLAQEPVHLEAALDYVELQSKQEPSRELTLLIKAKHDFESREDLLAKDYQESRAQLPEKNRLYEGYLQLIDVQILCLQQNQLQAKAKEILLQIIGDSLHPALVKRARLLLERYCESAEK